MMECRCFFSSRRRHTRWNCDWSSDVCSSDLILDVPVSSQEFLPPTEDAAELIDPWRSEAALIARIAKVQPEALYRRAAELMVELGGPDFDNAERTLRHRLDGMELKLVFRRPRAALGRRALGVATTELI